MTRGPCVAEAEIAGMSQPAQSLCPVAEARLITVSGSENGGAANGTTNQITSVIQTVLAAQLVSKGGMLGDVTERK